MNIFLDVLQDTVSDSLHMLPFLFAAFLLIETLELNNIYQSDTDKD